MIPILYFMKLGGFDRRYLPAYYEDVDLAFYRAKSRGKVLLQPLSRIVHVEGVSSGQMSEKASRAFQHQQDKFYQKWKDTLARHGGRA